MKKPVLSLICIFSLFLISPFNEASAQGFNTLKSAGQGLNKEGGGEEEGDEKGEKGDAKSKKGSSSKKSSANGAGGSGASVGDLLFIGQFEKYIPSRRYNARMTIYGEPAKFKYAERACSRTLQMRDRINTYLFSNPPKVDSKGRVDTTGIDSGVRAAIKKALKTKREYFTSIYVFDGRYNTRKKPKDIAHQSVTDCAGITELAKEMAREKK